MGPASNRPTSFPAAPEVVRPEPTLESVQRELRGASRFDAGAVAWHARLGGHAAHLTPQESGQALAALEQLGSSRPEQGARALGALCERHGLAETAAVLSDWLARGDSAVVTHPGE